MVDRVGQQFGNYRLTRLLGEGGFAEVYLGEHLHMGTLAAVKVLHTKFITREQEAFLRSPLRQQARPRLVSRISYAQMSILWAHRNVTHTLPLTTRQVLKWPRLRSQLQQHVPRLLLHEIWKEENPVHVV